MMPVRVHALVDSLTLGGAELLLSDFAAVAPDVGIDFSVGYLRDIGGSPAATRLRNHGVEPLLVGTRGLTLSALRGVRRHLSAVDPDVVHTHLGYSDLLGGLAARSLGLKTVSTIHAMHWEYEGATLRSRVKMQLGRLVRRRCADRVYAVSQSARRSYLDKGWDTPERVLTMYSGIVRDSRSGWGGAVRSNLGLEPEHLVVVMVSALRVEKGHDVAIAAVGHLRASLPQLRLLVVGEGPARAGLERMAAPLGDAVVFAGYRADVMPVLDAADVLLHPSRSEAFGISLIEAMAASVPIVATATGGIPELVQHDVNGLLVEAPPRGEEIAGALAALLSDPPRRRQMAKRGLERFENQYGARSWARRMRREYDSVLSEHAPSPRRSPPKPVGP